MGKSLIDYSAKIKKFGRSMAMEIIPNEYMHRGIGKDI